MVIGILRNKDENINVDFYYNGSAGGCMPFGLTHVRPPILDKGKHTVIHLCVGTACGVKYTKSNML